jgi:site-specific DNA-cytosine methylase
MVVAARMVAFGEYSVDGTASAMKARDYKDATDLVAQPMVVHGTQDPCVSDIAFAQGRNNGGENVLAYTTKMHNTTSNQAGKFYEEYSTSLDANSPPPAVFQPIPFDTTQITSPANYSKPQAGDPCHPLAAGAHAPAIAFSAKDHGADATVDLSPTLRAMGHADSHANGGGQMAVAQAIPIDTMNHIGRGDNHSFGDFEPGAPSYTLTKGHSYAVAQPIDPIRYGDHQQDTLHHESGIMSTLPSGTNNNAAHYTATVQAMQVRRLTPVECERLQGFPDNYSQIPWRKKPSDECPDGPRYKALGNSWAVPVVAWIGRRIHNAVLAAKRMEKEAA